jgi:hypothetical protein
VLARTRALNFVCTSPCKMARACVCSRAHAHYNLCAHQETKLVQRRVHVRWMTSCSALLGRRARCGRTWLLRRYRLRLGRSGWLELVQRRVHMRWITSCSAPSVHSAAVQDAGATWLLRRYRLRLGGSDCSQVGAESVCITSLVSHRAGQPGRPRLGRSRRTPRSLGGSHVTCVTLQPVSRYVRHATASVASRASRYNRCHVTCVTLQPASRYVRHATTGVTLRASRYNRCHVTCVTLQPVSRYVRRPDGPHALRPEPRPPCKMARAWNAWSADIGRRSRWRERECARAHTRITLCVHIAVQDGESVRMLACTRALHFVCASRDGAPASNGACT